MSGQLDFDTAVVYKAFYLLDNVCGRVAVQTALDEPRRAIGACIQATFFDVDDPYQRRFSQRLVPVPVTLNSFQGQLSLPEFLQARI